MIIVITFIYIHIDLRIVLQYIMSYGTANICSYPYYHKYIYDIVLFQKCLNNLLNIIMSS